MNITSRSYLTAGVAALGAGAIALTPVQPLPNHLTLASQRAVSNLSVELAAGINPIKPIVDTIKASGFNTKVLIQNWQTGLYVGGTIPTPTNTLINGNLGNRTGGYASGTPFPFLQQVLNNYMSYAAQLPDFRGIISEMIGNVGNALQAPLEAGPTLRGRFLLPEGDYNQNVSGVEFGKLLGEPLNPRTVGALLPALADVSALQPILDLATTPISGILVGALGPVLGPVLSAVDSVKAIIASIKDGQLANAINEALNLPTHMVDAFLNGGPVLDLTKALSSLLPPEVKNIGVKLGGLLSPGGVALDTIKATAETSAFGPSITINVPGYKVGPIGAFQGMMNYVANSIKPPQNVAASKRAQAAASTDEAPAPKQLRRAERKVAGSASSGRAPRSAAARHAR